MEELTLAFFPFPHVYRGERREGSMIRWAPKCLSCDRQCEVSREQGLRLCSYGVNYQRIDTDLLIAGVVVRDYPGAPTRARTKALREARRDTITRAQLAQVLDRAGETSLELERELRTRRNEIIARYQESKEYQQDVVELLRPELEQTLAQVHDYKQFVQQIVQNIDVILEARFPGEPLDEKVGKALHEEAAIYWAARLMDEKLDAALFMLYPDRIQDFRDRGHFRFHGLVTKYRKIYQSQIEAKNLHLHQAGESWGSVDGSSRAIGIIPHAYIDNAVKYAPHGTKIVLDYEEVDGALTFSVESFGPVILPEEEGRLFELFFRGQEAARRHTEGTGFGLAAAANVAQVLDLELAVKQTDRKGPGDTRQTTFSVRLPLAPEDRAPRPR